MSMSLMFPRLPRNVVAEPFLHARSFQHHIRFSSRMASKGRTYEDAIALLDTLQSNRTIVSSISKTSEDMNMYAIPEMLEWTRKAGYETGDFSRRGLKCIHVAGTKGKGSVCAMIDNILRQYRCEENDVRVVPGDTKRKGLGKIGLYTSPHLMTVRERIRIDGSPISEPLFARYFFELWDRFSDPSVASTTLRSNPTSSETKPGYFRYLTIMALHTFMEEGVETAIMECGIGGEYDSTNILPAEAVTTTAITKLGIDHVGMLGDTIDKIAWHKAGIMKKNIPCFTSSQLQAAQSILENRANEIGVKLEVVNRHSGFDNGTIELGAEGDFQKDNASLAMAVAASHLRDRRVKDVPTPSRLFTLGQPIPGQILEGIKTVKWAGRCEVVVTGNITWFIDGAHTVDSIKETGRWYASKLNQAAAQGVSPTKSMLIFNQQDRDPEILIRTLLENIHISFEAFDFATFCTNIPFKSEEVDSGIIDLSQQKSASKLYSGLDRSPMCMEYASIQEAVELAHRVSEDEERFFVLVTGSLHLVGGLMKVLEYQSKKEAEA
ncbi:e32f567f-41a2-4900-886a-3950eab54267 [Sclerotinia trifoliorum]|uniref:Folylpolyglutamate synthase n=1 Tax=Sclerotinia trifoliorum TaxID=28548 RepID=A0A8H2W018_9HELO|nr:e32f567f-41a2-4900-886a-3950eab54267 [Sclerotinia trifoliorum]